MSNFRIIIEKANMTPEFEEWVESNFKRRLRGSQKKLRPDPDVFEYHYIQMTDDIDNCKEEDIIDCLEILLETLEDPRYIEMKERFHIPHLIEKEDGTEKVKFVDDSGVSK